MHVPACSSGFSYRDTKELRIEDERREMLPEPDVPKMTVIGLLLFGNAAKEMPLGLAETRSSGAMRSLQGG